MSDFWLAVRRLQARWRSSDPVYKAFVESPLPQRSTPFEDAELVCLDIETTGLDPASADMLSVGWVLIRDGRVDLATAEAHFVKPECDVGQTASVHGLTDTIVGQGMSPTEAMHRVLEALTGKVLVVHYAGLDKSLLDRLCREQFGGKLLMPVIDTLALEHRRKSRHHHLNDTRSLRLPDLREHYNLPRYGGHDCLMDAVATAELLIAMAATRAHDGQITLADLYC